MPVVVDGNTAPLPQGTWLYSERKRENASRGTRCAAARGLQAAVCHRRSQSPSPPLSPCPSFLARHSLPVTPCPSFLARSPLSADGVLVSPEPLEFADAEQLEQVRAMYRPAA